MSWMVGVALKFAGDYMKKSIAQYPNIKTGAEFEVTSKNASATPP